DLYRRNFRFLAAVKVIDSPPRVRCRGKGMAEQCKQGDGALCEELADEIAQRGRGASAISRKGRTNPCTGPEAAFDRSVWRSSGNPVDCHKAKQVRRSSGQTLQQDKLVAVVRFNRSLLLYAPGLPVC